MTDESNLGTSHFYHYVVVSRIYRVKRTSLVIRDYPRISYSLTIAMWRHSETYGHFERLCRVVAYNNNRKCGRIICLSGHQVLSK